MNYGIISVREGLMNGMGLSVKPVYLLSFLVIMQSVNISWHKYLRFRVAKFIFVELYALRIFQKIIVKAL